jgi:hypothetical protein
MIELPRERAKASGVDLISKLVIIGHQGTGKTIACAQLPNSLVMDYEDGCKDHYEAMSVNLKKQAALNNTTLGAVHTETIAAIREANKKAGKFVYDYIIYDGLTALEKLAHQKATAMFKASVVGKGMISKGVIINDVVTDVPDSGWLWLHRAWDELYEQCIGLAGVCTIFIGHAKQGSLVKQGLKLEANDLALTGKLKLNLLRDCDASGMVYRDGNKVVLSFKTNEKDLTTKARARHLNESEFVLSEMKDDKLVTYWENVFPNLGK